MCVIINKTSVQSFDEQDFINANISNPDGFGYAYYDSESKRIVSDKILVPTNEELKDVLSKTKNTDSIYHFRIKTHGGKTIEQCHPFQVLNKEEHGVDMWFAHNGIIAGVEAVGSESDTMAFNRIILQPILTKDYTVVEQEWFRKLIEAFIGSSKLSFLYTDLEGAPHIKIFNEKLGGKRNECWVSNTHSFTTRKVIAPNNSKWGSDYSWEDMYFPKKVEPDTSKHVIKGVKSGDTLYITRTSDGLEVEAKVFNVYDTTSISCSIDPKISDEKGFPATVYINPRTGGSFMADPKNGNRPTFIASLHKSEVKKEHSQKKDILSVSEGSWVIVKQSVGTNVNATFYGVVTYLGKKSFVVRHKAKDSFGETSIVDSTFNYEDISLHVSTTLKGPKQGVTFAIPVKESMEFRERKDIFLAFDGTWIDETKMKYDPEKDTFNGVSLTELMEKSNEDLYRFTRERPVTSYFIFKELLELVCFGDFEENEKNEEEVPNECAVGGK